jgi:DNA polymerase-2
VKGFILTRQWRDTATGIQLDLWLATPGGPVQLLVPHQQAVFFLRATDSHQLHSFFSRFPTMTYKSVPLKNTHGEAVIACYCQTQRQARELLGLLAAQEIVVWEQDIKPVERFLMERFITASLDYDDAALVSGHKSFARVVTDRVKVCEYQPQLSMVSLDIETSLDAKQLYSIAIYNQDTAMVFMVDSQQQLGADVITDEGITLISCSSEKYCLQLFMAHLQSIDPDIIIGWHVVQFDLWVLEQLCRHWQLQFTIGRDEQLVHWRDDNQHPERRYAHVPGRVVLDGIELLRTAFYNFDSFSLQFVATALLGESKLLAQDNRAEAITDLFVNDKPALAKYNLQDCKLVWAIFTKTKLLDFAIERSRLTGMAMDRMGASVASFDYAYLPRLHRAGYVAPNLGELQSDVVSPGGYVMRSKPGLYRDVLVLDFKSLYPSIIRTFNIDPYAFWFAQHQVLPESARIEGYNGAYFSREYAILPAIITELWQARDRAKVENNKPLSQAIKIIMNSFYGVLGSPGCRFFDPRVCSSITLRGHDIIQRSRDWITQQGYDVIYGDTDSLFVWLRHADKKLNAQQIGQRLAQGLNAWWRQILQDKLAITSALEIEFETHYRHFLMPTIRGSSEGSKKRYAGIVAKQMGDDWEEHLVFKGLETVRTDWTELAKQFQQVLYYNVFKQQPYKAYICTTVADLLVGKLDAKLVYKKRLRRHLKDYHKNTPPHVKAARRWVDSTGQSLGRGDSISYVVTLGGPEPIDCRVSNIDYQHYIDKQLKPIANSILGFVGEDFNRIVDQQMVLL